MCFETYLLNLDKVESMLKQKLIKRRKEKGLSQDEMAHQLGIEQSQYSRRENGKTVISTREWIAMAKILDTTLEKIYEPQDGVFIINYGNDSNENSNNHSLAHYHQIESILEMKETIIEDKKKILLN